MATTGDSKSYGSAPPPPYYGYNQQGTAAPAYGSSQPSYAPSQPQSAYPGYAAAAPTGAPGGGQYGYNQGAGSQGSDPEATFNVSSFSDKVIRRSFIRKVYLTLTLQLLFTASVVALFVLHAPTRTWVQNNVWFYGLSYAAFLVTYIILICCPGVRRQVPGNYISLIVFTISFSYVTGAIASFHEADAVLFAAGITTVVVLSISLFAVQTKIDFTLCSGLLFAAVMVLLFAGFGYLIVATAIRDQQSYYYLQCTYGAIAALIMSLFLVFDTQMIVGGQKRAFQLSPEEHIVGALQLYLDIVYIFLIILGIGRK